jgi:hypothetical protein
VSDCKIGDLVHIPQAAQLIDFDGPDRGETQLTIPLRVIETDKPKVGVVTNVSSDRGYVGVFCEGTHWAIDPSSLYRVVGEE